MDQNLPNAPERDRRQKKRFLTRRNIGIVALATVAVFAGVSLWNELNPQSDDGTALLDTRKQAVEEQIVREATPYVDTGEVGEHDPREPLWAERPNQEEILGVDPYEAYRVEETPGSLSSTTDRDPAVPLGSAEEPFLEQRSDRQKSRIKITGSGTDLRIEKPDE